MKESVIANLGLFRKTRRTTQKSCDAPWQGDDPERNYEKLYSKLVQHHEWVGKAFKALHTQHEELGADLEEKIWKIKELNNLAQEHADLIKTKVKVIEELKNSLVEAKKPHFSSAGGNL